MQRPTAGKPAQVCKRNGDVLARKIFIVPGGVRKASCDGIDGEAVYRSGDRPCTAISDVNVMFDHLQSVGVVF